MEDPELMVQPSPDSPKRWSRRLRLLAWTIAGGVVVVGAVVWLVTSHASSQRVQAQTGSPSMFFSASTWTAQAGGKGPVRVGGQVGNSGHSEITVTGIDGTVPGGRLVSVTYRGRPLNVGNAVHLTPGDDETISMEIDIRDCEQARTGSATLRIAGMSGQQPFTTDVFPGVIGGSAQGWLADALQCGS